jgi:hypothetical protein
MVISYTRYEMSQNVNSINLNKVNENLRYLHSVMLIKSSGICMKNRH